MHGVYVQSITILFNQYSYSFIDGITYYSSLSCAALRKIQPCFIVLLFLIHSAE